MNRLLLGNVLSKHRASQMMNYSNAIAFRSLSSSSSGLPPHQVLLFPSLSPTMTTGNLANWKVKEGDQLKAGSAICEVETDKATVDFEVADEGYLAKILMKSGSTDIKVGTPIGVIVEDKADIPAFKDFAPPTTAAPAPAAAPNQEAEKPAQVQPVPKEKKPEPKQEVKKEEPKKEVKAAPSPTPAPQKAESKPSEPKKTTPSPAPAKPTGYVSPIVAMVAEERKKYENLYGSTFMSQ